MKTRLEYDLPNLSNDISHSEYQYRRGGLDALSIIFDFINNSKSDVKPNAILTFITDDMTKRGAIKLRINVLDK